MPYEIGPRMTPTTMTGRSRRDDLVPETPTALAPLTLSGSRETGLCWEVALSSLAVMMFLLANVGGGS